LKSIQYHGFISPESFGDADGIEFTSGQVWGVSDALAAVLLTNSSFTDVSATYPPASLPASQIFVPGASNGGNTSGGSGSGSGSSGSGSGGSGSGGGSSSSSSQATFATPNLTTPSIGPTSSQLIGANAARVSLRVYNDTAVALLILYGTGTASTTNFAEQISVGQSWSLTGYTGAIQAVTADGSSTVTPAVTEFTP
jgi:hypothetical protein